MGTNLQKNITYCATYARQYARCCLSEHFIELFAGDQDFGKLQGRDHTAVWHGSVKA